MSKNMSTGVRILFVDVDLEETQLNQNKGKTLFSVPTFLFFQQASRFKCLRTQAVRCQTFVDTCYARGR
jgi:hypothetical protein